MKSCLITARSYENLSAVFTIRNIYKPDDYQLTAENEFELNKKFAIATEKLKNHPDIEKLMTRMKKYNESLKYLGIKDDEVMNLNRRYFRDIASIFKYFSLFCLNSAFVNNLFYYIFYKNA